MNTATLSTPQAPTFDDCECVPTTMGDKNIFKSEIDNIENIGPKRKKNLILYFGSLEEVKKAEINQLQKVPGINKNVAESIYNYFRVT